MIYIWFLAPLIIGFIYLIWSEKDSSLEEKPAMKFIIQLVKFFGYFLGVIVITSLLWVMGMRFF